MIVFVSVEVLLPVIESVMPAGGVTVAVFARVPRAPRSRVADTVYVTEALTGRLTKSLILPEPLAVHVPAFAPAQVHVTVFSVEGSVSVTVAPVTA